MGSLAVVGFVAFAACGGETTNAASADAEFSAALTHAVCDDLLPCCDRNAIDYSASACEAQVKVWAAVLASGVHAGDTYNPSAAAACLARIAQGAVQCDSSLGVNPILTACVNVYSGARTSGESCVSTADCAPPPAGSTVQCNDPNTSLASGEDGGAPATVCVVITPDSVGAPCGYEAPGAIVDCASSDYYGAPASFYCDTQTETCQAALGLGAACDPSQVGCAAGLLCQGATVSGSTCVNDPAYAGAVAPGASCESDVACAGSGWCEHGGGPTAVCISSFMTQFCVAKGT